MTDLEMVQRGGLALKSVKKQTPEIVLAAVKQNGNAIDCAKKQTPEICLAAVRQVKSALKCVRTDLKFLFKEEYKNLTLRQIQVLVPELFL